MVDPPLWLRADCNAQYLRFLQQPTINIVKKTRRLPIACAADDFRLSNATVQPRIHLALAHLDDLWNNAGSS
jgi:hypothetical protein